MTHPEQLPPRDRAGGTDVGHVDRPDREDPTPGERSAVPVRALLVGAVAGFLSGLLGIGGGIVIVPALLGLLSMERRRAHGTSLAATLPVAAASLVTYAVHGNVDWAVAGLLAIGAVVGAVAGTQLLQIIPKRPLTIIFVVVVLATAARLAVSSDSSGRLALSAAGVVALVLIGFGTGTLSGLLGIGGGVIMVPVCIVGFSMLPVIAKGTSVAVIVPASLTGTLRNRSRSNVDLRVGIGVGLAGILTAIVGSTVSDLIAPTASNVLFALLLVVVAAIQLRDLVLDRHDDGEPLPPVE